MSYNKFHFKDLIERTLLEIGLYSEDAVSLLLGTAAQESRFGTYLRQLGVGPAKGAFQMEGATFNYLRNRYRIPFKEINQFTFDQLEYDLRASIIMARLKYYSCPGGIPETLEGQAAYWKKWYNTPLGAGTEAEYIENFKRYVA